jgi:hypothetical protein
MTGNYYDRVNSSRCPAAGCRRHPDWHTHDRAASYDDPGDWDDGTGVFDHAGEERRAARQAARRDWEDTYQDNTRYLRQFRRWQALREAERRGDQLQRETEAWLALAAQQAARRPAPPDLRRRPAITLI